MANKLNPKVVAYSLAIVSMIFSLLCALFLAIAPVLTVKFFGSIFHGIDISKIMAPVSVSGVLTGLVAIIILAFIAGWLFAVLYNYLSKKVK